MTEASRIEMSAEAKASFSAVAKHNFSRQHLRAGSHFSCLAAAREKSDKPTEEERAQHRAYVTGAIVFSVAFLEASINELYLEAIDRDLGTLSGLSATQTSALAEFWEIVENLPVLKKYQLALVICGKEKFDSGAEPYQGTDALVRVRNALVHYRPEWSHEVENHQKLQDRLQNRFSLNPFAAGAALWFPHQCLGAGCASWAIQHATRFMTDFCTRLGIPARLP